MPDTDAPHPDSTATTLRGFMDNPTHCRGIPYNTSSRKWWKKYVKGYVPPKFPSITMFLIPTSGEGPTGGSWETKILQDDAYALTSYHIILEVFKTSGHSFYLNYKIYLGPGHPFSSVSIRNSHLCRNKNHILKVLQVPHTGYNAEETHVKSFQ